MAVPKKHGWYLGRNPSAKRISLLANDYIALDDVNLPRVFGHVVNEDYGIFGNDTAGDCVIADIGHQLLIDAMATRRTKPPLTDASVLGVYSKWTGYDPKAVDAQGNNPTDQGTDMAQAARRWHWEGYPDATGVMHKSRGSAAGNCDWEQTLKLIRLFGAVSFGVNLPSSAVDQFNRKQPWSIVSGTTLLGGHCITGCGLNSRGNLVAISWGRTTAITRPWFERYTDEVIATFSQDYLLATGLSPELVDMAKLDADIASLSRAIG